MAGAGLGYLRLGMEKEGLEWLEKSWAGDQYNVRTFNTRNLFEKTIPKDYSFATTKNFRIRYHNEEKPVLVALPRADDGEGVRRHGEALRLHAEDAGRRSSCTPTATDYAIRTVGLPDLGALGVCFGQVITAMSPTTGDINWGMVLWHELGHVFAIQLSNSRVPRWFTEGLSEYETLIARPEWRRENDADLYGAIANGTLPSIGDAQLRVHAARSANAVVVAYYQSAVTIEYLVADLRVPEDRRGAQAVRQGQGDARGAAADHRQDDRAARRRVPQVPRHPARAVRRARSSCRPAASTTSPSSRSRPTPRPRTPRRARTSRSATTTAAMPRRPRRPRRPRSRSTRSSRSRATSSPRSRCTRATRRRPSSSTRA